MKKIILTALSMSLGLAWLSGCNPCQEGEDLSICGDFGNLAFATQLDSWDQSVRWPAASTGQGSILISQGSDLLEIGSAGQQINTNSYNGNLSAPSIGGSDQVYVVAGGSVSEVSAAGPHGDGGQGWAQSIVGESSGTPPTIGDDQIHVAVDSGDGQSTNLLSLALDSGQVTNTRPDASPATVAADGSLRYVVESQDCGALHAGLVAEAQDGNVRWRHDEEAGIRDFAPGPDGETYVVTGDNQLKRISADGSEEWSFTPDCDDCNVAAAPTVTDDAVYFPVWQGWIANGGCDSGGEPSNPEEAVDPLFALSRDGKVLWSYDGFETLGSRYSSNSAAAGMLGGSMSDKVRHHPIGRPTVAEDGTLFVTVDGAVAALDKDGRELGYALFEPAAGEHRSGDGGAMTGITFNQPGIGNAPLLDDQGTLFIWDGWGTLRGFKVNKKAARIPWTAPFGSARNAGRVGG